MRRGPVGGGHTALQAGDGVQLARQRGRVMAGISKCKHLCGDNLQWGCSGCAIIGKLLGLVRMSL